MLQPCAMPWVSPLLALLEEDFSTVPCFVSTPQRVCCIPQVVPVTTAGKIGLPLVELHPQSRAKKCLLGGGLLLRGLKY